MKHKLTADDIQQAQQIIAAMQATCKHDHGISESHQWIEGNKIVIRQCPVCYMFNPPRW